MASRPMATSDLILAPGVVSGDVAVAVAQAQKMGKLPTSPIAVQELR